MTASTRTEYIGLFSGGKDSITACHYHGVNEVIYCHTSVGLNEQYVKDTCTKLGWKLNIVYPSHDDEYERFVKEYTFPKPTSHTWIMNRLKSNPIRKWYNKEKHKRSIIFVSGIRRRESKKRFRTHKQATDVFEGMTFFKPILDWTKRDTEKYIKEHDLPISPIYATLGVSGDCFCGAFAKKAHGKILQEKYPELAKVITDLEKKYNDSWGQHMSMTDCQDQGTLDGLVCSECMVEPKKDGITLH